METKTQPIQELFVSNDAQELPDYLAKSEKFQNLMRLQKEGLLSKVLHEIVEENGTLFLKLTPIWSKKAIVGNTDAFLHSKEELKGGEPLA